ncbi:MAG TPA: site-2 protease family protein [Acidimicrobiales bacterium]|nr:site-2 protease family protein [Acidimicrobiales bacterium]
MDDTRRRNLLLVLGAAFVGWLAVRNGSLTSQSLLFFAALVPSVILHEVSHGAAALVFGDDTARRAGRLTLNPVPHVDPVWTLLVPGLLVLANLPVIGMARPVPVDPRRMRSPRNHSVLTSLAGPATNIALAGLAAAAYRAFLPEGLALEFVLALGVVNVVLAVFNLIPLPPLDGSAVVERFIPTRHLRGYYRVRQYAPVIFLVVFFMGGGLLGRIMNPAVDLWLDLLS